MNQKKILVMIKNIFQYTEYLCYLVFSFLFPEIFLVHTEFILMCDNINGMVSIKYYEHFKEYDIIN